MDPANTTTKEEILDVSMRLFYEKGYHQTSFQDISREAHVYRGTIYYYYKEKNMLRQDALVEHFRRCFRLAGEYCKDERYAPFLAHYIQWYKFLHDPKSRRFIVDYFEDEPFASAYGYVGGLIRLIDSDPSAYTAENVFYECLSSLVKLWGLDDTIPEKVRSVVNPYIEKLPKDRIDLTSL